MPRNHDEAVEWPDEATPSIAEVLHRLELSEQLLTPTEEPYDPESNPEDRPPEP